MNDSPGFSSPSLFNASFNPFITVVATAEVGGVSASTLSTFIFVVPTYPPHKIVTISSVKLKFSNTVLPVF